MSVKKKSFYNEKRKNFMVQNLRATAHLSRQLGRWGTGALGRWGVGALGRWGVGAGRWASGGAAGAGRAWARGRALQARGRRA